MERKVLHWLRQVPLIRDLDGDCEVIAQFELGKYLKQLDPRYHHPDYRVDFLVRVSDGGKKHQLVLEYDGFEFHFAKGVPSGMINSSTWPMYLTAEDLEREKVLESFGVQMIRLNKFNLGKDPVATIDGLLRERLDGMMNGGQPHDFVKSVTKKTNEIEEGLKTGDYKRCKKCDRDAGYFLLKRLPVNIPFRPRPIVVVTLKDRLLSPIAKVFIDCAREVSKAI